MSQDLNTIRYHTELPVPITTGRNSWKAVDFAQYAYSFQTVDFSGKIPANLSGKSFKLNSLPPINYVWFNLNSGNSDPGGGASPIQVDISTGQSAVQMAQTTASQITTSAPTFYNYIAGTKVVFYDKEAYPFDLTDVNSTLAIDKTNTGALPQDTFTNFDVSTLSNHGLKAYIGNNTLTGFAGGLSVYFFGHIKGLALANYSFRKNTISPSEIIRVYFRRGQFTPAGNTYFKQVWKHPPTTANIPEWSSSTTYSQGDFVKRSDINQIYSSHINSNLNHQPPNISVFADSNPYWKRLNYIEAKSYSFTEWDKYFRFMRWLQPVTTEISCTPDSPINFSLPPLEETWIIVDKLIDLPTIYPYEVISDNEIALRVVLATNIPRSILDTIKNDYATINNISAASSRINSAQGINNVSKLLNFVNLKRLISRDQ